MRVKLKKKWHLVKRRSFSINVTGKYLTPRAILETQNHELENE